MKTTATLPILALLLALDVHAQPPAAPPKDAPATAAGAPKPAVVDPEARFKAMLTKASLTGRWAPLRDGVLGDERGGDSYQIEGVTQTGGENWVVRAKLTYRQREFVLPIPVKVRFVGETAIMIVDGLAIPEGGTYSARLMFHDRTYSGVWTGGRAGGMLYGVITNAPE